MKFQLGKASLPLVECAQSSQADAGYAVVVVEYVKDVVQGGKVGTAEDWGTTKGESPQLGAGRQLWLLFIRAGILGLML